MARLIDWPDRVDLTPAEMAALKECARAEIDAIQAQARKNGIMTDEAYRLLDVLADCQVKLGLMERGR